MPVMVRAFIYLWPLQMYIRYQWTLVGQLCPDKVGGHKAEGTSNVVLGSLVPCLGFDFLEPFLEVSSRIDGEGVGEGDGRGLILRHSGWVGG